MIRSIVRLGRKLLAEQQLPELAKRERARDRATPLEADPGIDASVRHALDWIARAQDHTASKDDGVARDFSLINGWAPSYPETTGYIVPTLLACGARLGDAQLTDRARRMLDWLVSIQFPEGGFQGGVVTATPRVPVTFNTGQILMGLAAGTRVLGEAYRDSMRRAADWLANSQDADGCWRKHRTPFAKSSDKAYETHVSWGLYEAARAEPNDAWVQAANRQVRWAMTKQRPNGWFAENCLTEPERPLTHTIGYVLRGVLEAYRFTGDADFLDAAVRCGRGVQGALASDGRLPGRIDSQWRGAVDWVCLTGSVQIAHCWLLLSLITGERAFAESAYKANAFVRRSIRIDGAPGVVGGVKGSLPCDGGYLTWELPNWAAKFHIDAQLLEADVRAGTAKA
jgi:hypothetical protein